MFTIDEINKIPDYYFDIISTSAFAVTLRSKCTGHDWHILYQECRMQKHCILYHRHKPTYSFHLQCNAHTLASAIQTIQSHDSFHCQRKWNNKNLGKSVHNFQKLKILTPE